MNILILADKQISENIVDIVNNNNIELIITLGDLKLQWLGELEELNIPKIGVYGNHCKGNYMKLLNIENCHMKKYTYKGISIVGFQGSIVTEGKEKRKYYQEEATNLIDNLPKSDILISHSPAFGLLDNEDDHHIGFKGLRNYIEDKEPLLHLHGHSYPEEEELTHNGTKIIYTLGYKVITIND